MASVLTIRGELREQIEREVMEFAKRVRFAIAVRTPKKTGRAAASWNAALDAPNETQKTEPYDSPGTSPLDGEVNLEGFTLGREIHISNSRPYIRRLNAGYSQQAPAAFVEGVVEALRSGVEP